VRLRAEAYLNERGGEKNGWRGGVNNDVQAANVERRRRHAHRNQAEGRAKIA